MDHAFPQATLDDMSTLVPLVYVVIFLTMLLLLQSVTGTLATALVLVMAASTGMGLAGWLGICTDPALGGCDDHYHDAGGRRQYSYPYYADSCAGARPRPPGSGTGESACQCTASDTDQHHHCHRLSEHEFFRCTAVPRSRQYHRHGCTGCLVLFPDPAAGDIADAAPESTPREHARCIHAGTRRLCRSIIATRCYGAWGL